MCINYNLLQREGGIEVRDNSEVWQDLVTTFSQLVAAISQCLDLWIVKKQTLLIKELKKVRNNFTSLKTRFSCKPHTFAEIYNDVVELVRVVTPVVEQLHQWTFFISDHRQQTLSVWMKQLHCAMTLLPVTAKQILSLYSKQKCPTDLWPKYTPSMSLVCERLVDIVDDIIAIVSLQPSEVGVGEEDDKLPGAFLSAVDQVLEILVPAPENDKSAHHNLDSISNFSSLQKVASDDTCTVQNQFSNSDESKTEIVSKFPKRAIEKTNSFSRQSQKMSLLKSRTINSSSVCSGGVSGTVQTRAPRSVSQLVKEPLEDIMRHVISIAYCCSEANSRDIMPLCQEVCFFYFG